MLMWTRLFPCHQQYGSSVDGFHVHAGKASATQQTDDSRVCTLSFCLLHAVASLWDPTSSGKHTHTYMCAHASMIHTYTISFCSVEIFIIVLLAHL